MRYCVNFLFFLYLCLIGSIKAFPSSADHIGSFTYHIAEFAIDGNASTCSVACSPCDYSTERGFGWWRYDFKKEVQVESVEILTCAHEEEANYLRDTLVGLSQNKTTKRQDLYICNKIGKTYDVLPRSFWLTVRCTIVVTGRYLLLIRSMYATYVPDRLALAEIKVHLFGEQEFNMQDSSYTTNEISQPQLRRRLAWAEWQPVNLVGLRISQVGTYGGHRAGHATDGNPMSSTFACKPCDPPMGVGWWKVDLNSPVTVAAVQVFSSSREYESNMLQEFVVDVYRGKKSRKCAEYVRRTFIAPLTSIILACQSPVIGDMVMVRRMKDASFRRDSISLAEVHVFAGL